MPSIPTKPLLALLVLASAFLAGCSGGGGGDGGEGAPLGEVGEVDATATTGGIHGFVVDQKIVPIKGATITVTPGDKTTTTDDGGAFVISGLEPGTYFVRASHPLYDTQQQSADVVAGERDPQDLKFQLARVIFSEPYLTVEKFDGYIVCSAGHPEVGYSEECGEGVGAPCAVPVVGCQRVGGQDNNQVQYDFYIDTLDVKTILVELYWEPTAQTAASGELLTYVSTEWVCDPFCGGNTFVRGGSASPLVLRADVSNGTATNTTECNCDPADLVVGAPITVFTWANPNVFDPATGTVPVGSVVTNQPYQAYIVKSYYLPLPPDWSFVGGSDMNPF